MTESAFEHAASALWRTAWQAARRYGATSEEAEDTAQEVMLRLWQMHSDLSADRKPDALAALMARRLTIDRLRRAAPADIGSAEHRIQAAEPDPQQQLEDQENEQWLSRRLQSLPTNQHTILYMRQVEHRDTPEIARLLGIGEASVRTLLSRARRTLLEEIKRRR